MVRYNNIGVWVRSSMFLYRHSGVRSCILTCILTFNKQDLTPITLLAKQLLIHGFNHSERPGALNKMIAVHNFHNAVEVALRCIFLKYEIRGEKQLNIEFGAMLNDIDNHQLFRDKGIKLPYRQELRI